MWRTFIRADLRATHPEKGACRVMHIDLVVTKTSDDQLGGAVRWVGQPESVEFHGVLELVALLEEAAASEPSVKNEMNQ
jgi:hypothetical protein